ncbi:MAG: dethiobiotin synthase [Rhodothermales bacterium]|nr:dethiobiotin synthase [Rhodothermales bacterium]MBO6778350.1 dethiobiotin synthase [Rhodothermales bacterium]
MAEGLFLVGSSRGVGQTLVGLGLVGLLRKMGVDATMMTPITTGGSGESTADALGRLGIEDPRPLTEPVKFETMAAPYVASRIEGRPVSLESILDAFRDLRSRHEFVVVDGGGILVPIAERFFMIDLLERMGLPSIIVGRTARGTLNHCLLTQRMMFVQGAHPLGFILNGFGQFGDGFAEAMNPEVLAELARPTPVLASIEWRPSYPNDVDGLVQALEQQTHLVDVLRGITS